MAMREEMDVLLRQWGQERAAPVVEASVRSPLGDTDQWMGGGRSTAARAGLGIAAQYAQHSRVYQLVDEALRSMSDAREEGGMGGRGAVLYTLAKVRYVHQGEMPAVAAQLVELGISKNTYRAQLAELHGWLEPRVMAAMGVEVRAARQHQAQLREAQDQAERLRVEVLERQRKQAISALLDDRSSAGSSSFGTFRHLSESA